MENLKKLPFNQPIDGILVPGTFKASASSLERLILSLKVGQCVRLETAKETSQARWFVKKHGIPVVVRAVGDGSYVLWRRRKNGKSA